MVDFFDANRTIENMNIASFYTNTHPFIDATLAYHTRGHCHIGGK